MITGLGFFDYHNDTHSVVPGLVYSSVMRNYLSIDLVVNIETSVIYHNLSLVSVLCNTANLYLVPTCHVTWCILLTNKVGVLKFVLYSLSVNI